LSSCFVSMDWLDEDCGDSPFGEWLHLKRAFAELKQCVKASREDRLLRQACGGGTPATMAKVSAPTKRSNGRPPLPIPKQPRRQPREVDSDVMPSAGPDVADTACGTDVRDFGGVPEGDSAGGGPAHVVATTKAPSGAGSLSPQVSVEQGDLSLAQQPSWSAPKTGGAPPPVLPRASRLDADHLAALAQGGDGNRASVSCGGHSGQGQGIPAQLAVQPEAQTASVAGVASVLDSTSSKDDGLLVVVDVGHLPSVSLRTDTDVGSGDSLAGRGSRSFLARPECDRDPRTRDATAGGHRSRQELSVSSSVNDCAASSAGTECGGGVSVVGREVQLGGLRQLCRSLRGIVQRRERQALSLWLEFMWLTAVSAHVVLTADNRLLRHRRQSLRQCLQEVEESPTCEVVADSRR